LKGRLKRCFLAGVLVLLPLVITVFIFQFIVGLMDGLLRLLPGGLHPDNYLPVHVPGLGLILAVVLTVAVGGATRYYVGGRMVAAWERLLRRIPLVRNVYGASKQLLEAVFVSGSDSFKRAVLVEFPRPGVYAIGLVTGPTQGEVAELGLAQGQRLINVYLPHTPNPTGGVFIAFPEEQVRALEMTVEEALKVIISGGIVTPPTKRSAAAKMGAS
jgi:uncharacterized membrane protein